MSRLAEQAPILIENVVSTLCGTHVQPRPELGRMVERAEGELDAETAHAWALALLEHLTACPEDSLALEALLVLGLAHPEVHRKHRISMPQEGRRLAVLLERGGDAVRAECMLELLIERNPRDGVLQGELAALVRRNGSLGRKVERHLRSAEEAMRQGHRAEAIRWLREVLALDPRRRDVARMIRDLRFEEQQVREGWVRRARLAAAASLAVGLFALGMWRERSIASEFATLPAARPGDLASTQERLDSIDALFDSNLFWLGMWSAGRERSALRVEVEQIQSRKAAEVALQAEQRARAAILANAERAQALVAADRFEFDNALVHFRAALELAPPGWEPLKQIEREVARLEEWERTGELVSRGGQE